MKTNTEARLRFYEKNDDQYLDYFDPRVDFEMEDAYFYFENIKSPDKSGYKQIVLLRISNL